jgi:hypothetical protein
VVQLDWNDKPRGIDLDTCDGVIYFTNWNTHAPSVQRVWAASGYGLESVVTTDIRFDMHLIVIMYSLQASLSCAQHCQFLP